ncbi:helix-turn-helix transcriptional regulator [Hyphococcus flavus]|uniref:Helix-turn-helix transcriptional regulator n=1 Tax=Hyphococcus flavus TaxID=1866326 RepID=A0AAE9ZCG9_9PROT|nr:helix-turn-helix transcriptional regulator [Hyphococcus flavus]WDI32209.1 helix-turn-helix transcriptional regulator [Hyphococcus flavus]
MTKRKNDTSVTELEGTAMAIIKRDGPCTTYAIKEVFRTSPSEYWSGSAGAVYPLMNRLEARKYIKSKADKSDGRARREFTITKAGEKALMAWLTDSDRATGLGFDPLRTRLFFADLLTDKAYEKFHSEVMEKMEQVKSRSKEGEPPLTSKIMDIWIKLRLDGLRKFNRK